MGMHSAMFVKETMNRNGAMALAGQIRRCWQERGARDLEVRVEPIVGMDGLYQIRSNMVCGWPLSKATA